MCFQRINHRKFRKRRWNFPSLLSSHHQPQFWGKGDLGNYKKWWTKFIPHTGRLSRFAVPLLSYCKTTFPLPGFAHVVSPFSHFCLNPTSRLDLIPEASLKHVWQISLASHLWIQQKAVCSCSISRTKWLDAGICHEHFASLCHFPLSKFNIFYKKIRVEPRELSHKTTQLRPQLGILGHLNNAGDLHWSRPQAESGALETETFEKLRSNLHPMVGDTSHRLLPVEICKTTFACGAVGGLGRSVAVFFSADISLTYCQKVGEFPGSYVWSEKLFPDS